MDTQRWEEHFRRNQNHRPEPDWSAPITLSDAVRLPLLRSLEQFCLGDGGGPAYLIAGNREGFLVAEAQRRALVDAWFREEREHSRLLGALVARLGGSPITSHWSFSAFCTTRRVFGVSFELTVLLLTEISSTAYYRLLRRHGDDTALRDVCKLILRDEAGHIAFHRARLASSGARFGRLWALWFSALGHAAATMLWLNHGPALRAVGASRAEFYRELRRELALFIRRLRSERSGETHEESPPLGYRAIS
jgi:hypothetical protein